MFLLKDEGIFLWFIEMFQRKALGDISESFFICCKKEYDESETET